MLIKVVNKYVNQSLQREKLGRMLANPTSHGIGQQEITSFVIHSSIYAQKKRLFEVKYPTTPLKRYDCVRSWRTPTPHNSYKVYVKYVPQVRFLRTPREGHLPAKYVIYVPPVRFLRTYNT